MKLAVSSYSFARLMRDKGLSELDIIPLAKEIGFDAMEFAGLAVPKEMKISDYAHKVRSVCDENDIMVTNYAVSGNLLVTDYTDEIRRIKDELDIAAILGSSFFRHDVAWNPPADGNRSFAKNVAKLAAGCQEITEYGASIGIQTMIENHGYFCQGSFRVEMLVDEVNNQNFGVLFDMGNFLCVDEDPCQALGVLLPYIKTVHIKDFYYRDGHDGNPGEGWFNTRGGNFIQGAIVGQGIVPVSKCLHMLAASKYNGVIALEYEGLLDVLPSIKIGYNNIKKMLAVIFSQ